MSIFRVLMKYSDGTENLEETEFDTEEAAEEYGNYLISCDDEGAENLYLSNPGDYPLDDYESLEYEIIETEK